MGACVSRTGHVALIDKTGLTYACLNVCPMHWHLEFEHELVNSGIHFCPPHLGRNQCHEFNWSLLNARFLRRTELNHQRAPMGTNDREGPAQRAFQQWCRGWPPVRTASSARHYPCSLVAEKFIRGSRCERPSLRFAIWLKPDHLKKRSKRLPVGIKHASERPKSL